MALDEFAAHIARYHRKILVINRAVAQGRHADEDLAALYDKGLQAWLAGSQQLMSALEAEGRLAEPWTVATASDMLLALMRDEVTETLVVARDWPEQQHRELLATLLRRTFVR